MWQTFSQKWTKWICHLEVFLLRIKFELSNKSENFRNLCTGHQEPGTFTILKDSSSDETGGDMNTWDFRNIYNDMCSCLCNSVNQDFANDHPDPTKACTCRRPTTDSGLQAAEKEQSAGGAAGLSLWLTLRSQHLRGGGKGGTKQLSQHPRRLLRTPPLLTYIWVWGSTFFIYFN